MEYAQIMDALAAYKTADKERFSEIKTTKDGIHLYEYKGVLVRVLYVFFDDKIGSHYASVRRSREDTWTVLRDFETGGTEARVYDPAELTPKTHEWDEDEFESLQVQAIHHDSMSVRREAQNAIEAMLKNTVHSIVDNVGWNSNGKHDDVTGWEYSEEKRRLVRPWE